jgi:hypothetical protein
MFSLGAGATASCCEVVVQALTATAATSKRIASSSPRKMRFNMGGLGSGSISARAQLKDLPSATSFWISGAGCQNSASSRGFFAKRFIDSATLYRPTCDA